MCKKMLKLGALYGVFMAIFVAVYTAVYIVYVKWSCIVDWFKEKKEKHKRKGFIKVEK